MQIHSAPPPSSTPETSIWRQRFNRYKRPLSLTLMLLLFTAALIACRHLLDELDPGSLHAALLEISPWHMIGAVGATVAGFIALLGYEWSAQRYAAVKIPTPALLLGGFSAFAIGNAVGISLLSGGSVRYRLYSRIGASAAEITRMSLFASLSLGCSLPILAALAALANLPAATQAVHLPASFVAGCALAVLAMSTYAVIWLSRQRMDEQPFSDSLLVRVRKQILRLPGARLSALQLLISLLDVTAAATVLYLLLPEAPPFSSFLLIYLLALAAGVLSHVPGGAGVFEAVMLTAFADSLGAAPLAAALLLYRLIYIVAPLVIACLLLLLNEALIVLPSRKTLRAATEAASGLAAPVLALLVFLAGMVLLFSGATPALDNRLIHLGFLIPHHLIDASHFGASLIGVLCLLLAQGLRRRLSAAWTLTMTLLLAGALLSLLKGFDWEEALLLTITACLLGVFRISFYRPSRLLEMPFSGLYLAAALCALLASIWLMLFAYQDVPYDHELWWQFALDAKAPRALRSALGSALLLTGLSLTWLLRASPHEVLKPNREQLEKAAQIIAQSNQADGGLALTGDKALLFHASGNAFVMYAQRSRSLIALFDPIGPARERAELIWQFRDLCDRHNSRPVFYQVRAENLPFYMDIGLSAIKLGEEARVDLLRFDLENQGKAMKDLRYTWNRSQRDGLKVEFYQPGQAPFEQLQTISDTWLQGKSGREKGFSLGRFDRDYLSFFRIAVVYDGERPVAFCNLLETQTRQLASLDLMRVSPDAPKLTMEFLMLALLMHFKEQGLAQFSLGMVPLAGMQPRRGAPMTQRLGALVFQRGEGLYNFQGLRRFKEKFQPTWEPRYMAVPTGIDPYIALADTAALIAGGYSGLIKH